MPNKTTAVAVSFKHIRLPLTTSSWKVKFLMKQESKKLKLKNIEFDYQNTILGSNTESHVLQKSPHFLCRPWIAYKDNFHVSTS